MLQAILDCAYESFKRYNENCDVWMTIRGHCKGLLGDKDYYRYHELCDREIFNYDVEDNRLREWKDFLDKFDPYYGDVRSSDYDGQVNLHNDIKNEAKVMRERVIAHDQLKAFTLYLKGKPAQTAAYHEFLVSIYILFCMIYFCCDDNLTPSFCRCTTVARQPRDWRLGSHWCLRCRGVSSRLQRGILM